MSEDSGDFCLEIDALEGEFRFVCRHEKCKKVNRIKLAPPKSDGKALPAIGISR